MKKVQLLFPSPVEMLLFHRLLALPTQRLVPHMVPKHLSILFCTGSTILEVLLVTLYQVVLLSQIPEQLTNIVRLREQHSTLGIVLLALEIFDH